MSGSLIIVILVVLLVIFILAKGLRIVPESSTMVIERLGKYHKTLNSGVNMIFPIFDKPKSVSWRKVTTIGAGEQQLRLIQTKWIDLREQVYDYPKQNVITKDNVTVQIDAVLYFQITDPKKAVYEIADFPVAIEKLTQTTLRNVIGELELDESLTSRDTINSKLRIILDEATDKWGVKVNRVELQDIIPPEEIRAQMEKQMRAERDKRAAILVAEGEKQSAILSAQGYKEAEINRAEGLKTASILKAEGEAKALETIKKVFKDEGDYVQYIVALRYLDTLKEMTSGQDNKTVYLPYEASGILSSIGSFKELFNK